MHPTKTELIKALKLLDHEFTFISNKAIIETALYNMVNQELYSQGSSLAVEEFLASTKLEG
tara:strand:+ start:138 stop:320 length:183 start_codon:yes stop_codon:yes gene_type:complete